MNKRLEQIRLQKRVMIKSGRRRLVRELLVFSISICLISIGMFSLIPTSENSIIRAFSIGLIFLLIYILYQYVNQFIDLLEYQSAEERRQMKILVNEEQRIEYKILMEELKKEENIE